jgi:hypothetical protein
MLKNLIIILFLGVFVPVFAQDKVVSDAEKVVRFYPNPASTVINFEFDQAIDRNYTLQIYNFVGKKVVERTNLAAKTSLPLNDFYRGVYVFQLRDKSGKIIESGKFQVAK